MNMIVSLCGGVCASLLGMALFCLGRRETEMQAVDEVQDKNQNKEQKMPMLKWAFLPCRFWQAFMWIGNIALAVFLTMVYAADPLEVLQMVLLCTVLCVCAWTDCRAYLIPNKILLAALLLWIGLFIAEAFLEPWNVRYAAVGTGVSAAGLLLAGILCRLFVPGSVGFGDLKLFIILALYLGADHTWNAIFYTLLASFAASVFLLAARRVSRKSVMPFAPFLLFGTLLAAFFHGV